MKGAFFATRCSINNPSEKGGGYWKFKKR